MLEIIAIVLLCKHIAKILKEKGLKPTLYVVATVALWVGFELLGGIVGFMIGGSEFVAYFTALGGAALGGYLGYLYAKGAAGKAEFSDSPIDAQIIEENRNELKQ